MNLNSEELVEMIKILGEPVNRKRIQLECMDSVEKIAKKIKKMVDDETDGKDNRFMRQQCIFEKLAECIAFIMAGSLYAKCSNTAIVLDRIEYIFRESKNDFKRYVKEQEDE